MSLESIISWKVRLTYMGTSTHTCWVQEKTISLHVTRFFKMLLKRPWMQLINMIQKNNFWAAWGWWPHAARYTLEIFRYIVSAWQRTASQVCRGRWGTGKACHQQSHVRAASPEQYQKKKRKEGQSYFCNSAGSEWASMLLRCCLAWSAVLQSRWTVSTNWKWKIDSLNGEKFIKVAEVQGTEVKVCLCYIFHVAIMQK